MSRTEKLIDNVWVDRLKNDVITSAEAVKGVMSDEPEEVRYLGSCRLWLLNDRMDSKLKTIGVEVIDDVA